jgi:2-oxoglutarate dehydrogenase E1 component
LGINSWLEDELYQQYLRDRPAVDERWKQVFEKSNGATVKPAAPATAPEGQEVRGGTTENRSGL